MKNNLDCWNSESDYINLHVWRQERTWITSGRQLSLIKMLKIQNVLKDLPSQRAKPLKKLKKRTSINAQEEPPVVSSSILITSLPIIQGIEWTKEWIKFMI